MLDRYVRSCPDTTTPSLRSDGAGWCPTVSDMCAERCDFEECDADKECALPATTYSLFDTSTDSPACSCEYVVLGGKERSNACRRRNVVAATAAPSHCLTAPHDT